MSIVHTIADLHGIGLEVNSIEGLGSSFLLTFPPVTTGPGGDRPKGRKVVG
ncbi:hypothetical protein GCM10011495_31310 [Hymenobacter frigidus]|uniref:Sensor histidine kinase n=1 Tax=Hymenobacter frigidus TaxID=1524095 RepID=A0ABQ2ACP1_9BACT|nr:hypothetical protein GCM10011495_31310 [Hymenobacter frigidus]